MKDEKDGQMKELDFDELHDAVNKLMDQAQKPKAKREPVRTVAKAVTRPSVKVAERSSEKDKPDTKEEQDDEPITVAVRHAPRASVAPKKRGMAMDVVQVPKPAVVAPPSARAARTAPTLQPTGLVKPEPPSPRAPSPAALVALDAAAPVDDVSEDTLASINMHDDGIAHPPTVVTPPELKQASAFPDPLDVHGFNDAKQPAAALAEPAQDDNMPDPLSQPNATMAHGATNMIAPPTAGTEDESPVPAPKNQWDMPEPIKEEAESEEPVPVKPTASSLAPADATPFVNAKVEKRPLGAFADTRIPVPAPPTEPAPEPKALRADAAQVEVQAAPEELSPEVVAVESAEPEFTPTVTAQTGEPLQNLRQMSIPQQYHASDKEPSRDDRPVFDTKNYHTPLQPVATAKRPSGSRAGMLLTLVLIILLVAAGVAAYFVATGSVNINKLF